MSRLTAAQVIGLGEYLNSDFDPSTLTVPQLLGILGYHGVNFPTAYNKPKLIQLFNDEVKAKSTKLKKERIKKENSIASDDGIKDGLTGEPIGGRKPTPRRSSRRLSRAPGQDQETSPVHPEPPKRRRSSAQPSLGGPSRKLLAVPSGATLVEESEPDDDDVPVRKVGRSKKSVTARSQARRVSQGPGDDSGWEDNNIFQSGAESSSPIRPSPIRPKAIRKSDSPRKSRKSMSAPPQMSSPSPPQIKRFQRPEFIPPQTKFEPQLPPSVTRETRTFAARLQQSAVPSTDNREPEVHHPFKQEVSDDELNLGDVPSRADLSYEKQQSDVTGEVGVFESGKSEADEGQNVPISQPVVRVVPRAPTDRRSVTDWDNERTPFIIRALFYLLTIAAGIILIGYKQESSSIGFCDAGSNTNQALEDLKGKLAAMEACHLENSTLLHFPPVSTDANEADDANRTLCPLPALIPRPHATSCMPCPEHATCTQFKVTCNTGYILRSHPLVFFLPPHPSPSSIAVSTSTSPTDLAWKVISLMTDGLPWLGSIGLPPHCIEDPKRKKHIGALGKAIEAVLGQERGRRVCAGGINATNDDSGSEAQRWGLELESLRDQMKQRTPPHLLVTFDDTFNEAIQQLIQWGGVVFSEDSSGRRYLAHKTPDLTWSCALTVKLRTFWQEQRRSIFAVVTGVIVFYFLRARRAQGRIERHRVAELVQIALDTLRNQELAHYTDPVTAPHPYLSSLQLRDLILQDEHSVSTRRRLWEQVERIVESNANVRANLEEVQGGDELRVWRWIGSTSHSPRKILQVDEKEE